MLRLLLLAVFVVIQSSCIPGFGKKPSLGPYLHLSVSISERVNQNHPIEVDIVMVYDKDLLEQLSEMPAKEWFQRRFQLENENIGGQKMEFSTWEWTPGQLVDPINLQFSQKGWSVVLFANFLAEGVHRVRIDEHDRLRIFLADEGLEVQPL
jgi:type VI secretion system protein